MSSIPKMATILYAARDYAAMIPQCNSLCRGAEYLKQQISVHGYQFTEVTNLCTQR